MLLSKNVISLLLVLISTTIGSSAAAESSRDSNSLEPSEPEAAVELVERFLNSEVGTSWLDDLTETLNETITKSNVFEALMQLTRPYGKVWNATKVLSTTQNDSLEIEEIDREDNFKNVLCLDDKTIKTITRTPQRWKRFIKSLKPTYTAHRIHNDDLPMRICLEKIVENEISDEQSEISNRMDLLNINENSSESSQSENCSDEDSEDCEDSKDSCEDETSTKEKMNDDETKSTIGKKFENYADDEEVMEKPISGLVTPVQIIPSRRATPVKTIYAVDKINLLPKSDCNRPVIIVMPNQNGIFHNCLYSNTPFWPFTFKAIQCPFPWISTNTPMTNSPVYKWYKPITFPPIQLGTHFIRAYELNPAWFEFFKNQKLRQLLEQNNRLLYLQSVQLARSKEKQFMETYITLMKFFQSKRKIEELTSYRNRINENLIKNLELDKKRDRLNEKKKLLLKFFQYKLLLDRLNFQRNLWRMKFLQWQNYQFVKINSMRDTLIWNKKNNLLNEYLQEQRKLNQLRLYFNELSRIGRAMKETNFQKIQMLLIHNKNRYDIWKSYHMKLRYMDYLMRQKNLWRNQLLQWKNWQSARIYQLARILDSNREKLQLNSNKMMQTIIYQNQNRLIQLKSYYAKLMHYKLLNTINAWNIRWMQVKNLHLFRINRMINRNKPLLPMPILKFLPRNEIFSNLIPYSLRFKPIIPQMSITKIQPSQIGTNLLPRLYSQFKIKIPLQNPRMDNQQQSLNYNFLLVPEFFKYKFHTPMLKMPQLLPLQQTQIQSPFNIFRTKLIPTINIPSYLKSMTAHFQFPWSKFTTLPQLGRNCFFHPSIPICHSSCCKPITLQIQIQGPMSEPIHMTVVAKPGETIDISNPGQYMKPRYNGFLPGRRMLEVSPRDVTKM